MKKYNFLFLFLLLTIQLQAQNISVKSFRLLENDLDARVNYPKLDQNGDKCAIIKVVTTEDGFTWDGDALGITTVVKKQAEYWLYVPRGAKRITISHSKLGLLRNYAYTIPIEESTVYELVLVTGKVITTVQENEIESQWLIINTEPAGADVYINDLPAGKTPYQNELPIGKYTWRLQKELYLNESGFLELTDSVKQKMDIKFKPNYGTLNIVSEPEVNANVYINGMAIGKTTPCKVEQIPSGEKTIKLIKDLYEFIDKQVILTPESNQQLAFTAKPSFGTINISTTPESNAFVSLDGQSLNKTTPCSKEYVPLGEHTISVSLDMYETTSQNINLASGETKSITIDMKPTFAGVSITTEPIADIYVNGQRKANGNWQGRLNPGVYTFEAKLDKHTTATEKQTVNIGQPLEIKLNPTPRLGMLKVMTTPFEANISINGKNYGTTPATIKELLIGDYTIELSLSGYATAIEKTTITEGQTATINAILANGKEVNISSIPFGVDLFIDNIKVGITPYKTNLTFGDHNIRIVQENEKAEKTISILQNGGETNYILQFGREILITSIPSGVDLFIDNIKVGITPYKTNLAFGSHSLRIEQDSKKAEKTINITQIGGETNFAFFFETVNDIDGNVYDIVKIGSQTWIKQNLNTTHYSNGDAIPNVIDDNAWKTLTTGAYCDYNNTPSISTTYGRLYNFYSVVDSRKLCPTGWHVPSDTEWSILIDYLGCRTSIGGGKLKEAGFAHWNDDNIGATNEIGSRPFSGGYRSYSGQYFSIPNDADNWWSSTESVEGLDWERSGRKMNYNSGCHAGTSNDIKTIGVSVRCLKTSLNNQLGREVNISSIPSGIDLFIDNIKVGVTPYKTNLAYGSHRLRIEQNSKKAENTINILQNGGETSFVLSFVETVTDIDGNVYDIVKIGSQTWIKQNLKTTRYSNGDAIPNVTETYAWGDLKTGAYCDYDNTPSNSTTYGRLYNFYTVVDSRKLCPTGWHVPSDTEWSTLITYLGGETIAGGKLKEAGIAHWVEPNKSATNETGFTALPGGCRFIGDNYIGDNGFWWSSKEYDTTEAWERNLTFGNREAFRSKDNKETGFSVRCLRD
jgi:uncharacterized protein (TIGR02145 family)